jgi:NADPH:quinone reductase-like Zn-dependent oxidoreductase
VRAAVWTRYEPPEVLQVREVEKPDPRSNEVRIAIFATAVTASDCIVREFDVPVRLRLPMGLALGTATLREFADSERHTHDGR